MKTTRYREWSPCPHCGVVQDAASSVAPSETPRRGDFSICIRCAGVSVFEHGGRRRLPNEQEKINAATDPEVLDGVAKVRMLLDLNR